MAERVGLEVDTLTIRIPIRLQRRGGRKLIMTPEGAARPMPNARRDETLVKALVRAHRWRRRIESGRAKSITDLAEQEGVTNAYVCRLLPLTCLAPDIVEAILDGRQPKGLNSPRCWGMDPRPGWSSGPPGAVRNRDRVPPAGATRALRRTRLRLGGDGALLSRSRPRGRHIVVGWRADTPALTEARGDRVRVKHQELA